MLAEVFATEGLWLIALGTALAGLVRGFSGFGTAMIYLPFAAQVMDPIWVIVSLLAIDIVGPMPAVPRALRDGQPMDVVRLGIGAAIGVPIGMVVLFSISPEPFRYLTATLTFLLLIALVTGYRYRGHVGRKHTFGVGALGGLLGGAIGLAGPPIIFFYMARPLPVAAIRANILLYLVVIDVLMIAIFAWQGALELYPILIGVSVLPIYLLAIVVGSKIFDPERETVYRWVAYAIIGASAIGGLPIWD